MRSTALAPHRHSKIADHLPKAAKTAENKPPRNLGLKGVVEWLFIHLLDYRALCGWILLSLFLKIGYDMFSLFFLKNAFDNAVKGEHISQFAAMLGVLVVAYVISAIADVTSDSLQAQLVNQFSNDLRFTMFEHLQQLSIGYYANVKTGDLLSHFSSDLDAIEKATPRFIEGAGALLGLIVGGGMLLYFSWQLALAVCLVLPLISLGSRLFAGRASTASFYLQKEKAAMMSTVQENILAQRVIKAFGLQPNAIDQMAKQLANLVNVGARADFFGSLVGTSSDLCVRLTQLVVISFGVILVFNKGLSVGSLAASIQALNLISKYAYDLAKKQTPALIKAGGGILRIQTLLTTQPRVVDETQAVALPAFKQRIRFEDVEFGYTSQTPILKKLSLTIPIGKSIAFVGPSGAGKSTIINLLLRFYDATSGRITIDGQDIRKLTAESLRQQIGVVFQDTFLFNTSIRENIRMSKLDATDADVERAAKAAELHDLIMSWSQGYNTNVGELGGSLSGGQRQRIAIARAMLRNPAILVLDEATSALDATTEAAIMATLERLGKNRTVIWVTHHLSTVENVDQICVLEGGRLVEQGRHAELLARRGVYATLWQTQTGQALAPVDAALSTPVVDNAADEQPAPASAPQNEADAQLLPNTQNGEGQSGLPVSTPPSAEEEEGEATYRPADDIPQPLLGYFVRVTNNPNLPSELPIYGLQPAAGETRQIHIGRHTKHNTVVINDKTVSREHAVLIQKEGRVYLRDNASTAGTLLNWRRLKTGEELLLRHNDVVGFGEIVYEFRTQGSNEAADEGQ
ncbi:MAG: ATP-binding cassette domain-containing protein [Caldilineaceae bacterium]